MKYKIITACGSEGWRFEDEDYDNAQLAAYEIMTTACAYDRKIVGIVDYKELIK